MGEMRQWNWYQSEHGIYGYFDELHYNASNWYNCKLILHDNDIHRAFIVSGTIEMKEVSNRNDSPKLIHKKSIIVHTEEWVDKDC